MIDRQYRPSVRLADLPIAVKVFLTVFCALIGLGFLAAQANIYFHHRDADLEPGLGLGDLLRTFHGLEKPVAAGAAAPRKSHMLAQVSPGGAMRKYLEKGGEESVRALIHWLENGAKEEDFAREGLVQAGDPSPRDVIAETCVRCHNAAGGEKADVPYAENRDAMPTFALVSREAVAEASKVDAGSGTMYLAPHDLPRLVHVTHTHIFTVPTFVLLIGILFFLSGVGRKAKAVLGPIPIIAVLVDIGSWWLARAFAPFVFAIAAAGAVLGIALALQLLAILWSLWIQRPETAA